MYNRNVRNVRHQLTDLHTDDRPNQVMKIISDGLTRFTNHGTATSKPVCPWWDEELESMRKLKNKLRNSGRYAEYKDLKREMRRVFRRKRKRHRTDLIQKMSEDPNPFKILRVLSPQTRARNRRRHRIALDPVSRSRKVNQLADTYQDLLNQDLTRIITDDLLQVSDRSRVTFTRRELKSAITQSNKRSAPGDDESTYRTIERLSDDD